jgi:hypothetical protein
MKDEFQEGKTTDLSYGLICSEIWPRKTILLDKMFEFSGAEKRMKLCFFDIPELHLNNSTGKRFINALNETEDVEIFS